MLAYLFKVNSEVLLLVVGDVPPLGRAVRPSSIPLGFVAPRVTDPTRLRYNVLRYRFFYNFVPLLGEEGALFSVTLRKKRYLTDYARAKQQSQDLF